MKPTSFTEWDKQKSHQLAQSYSPSNERSAFRVFIILSLALLFLTSCKKEEEPALNIWACCMFIEQHNSDVPAFSYKYKMLGNLRDEDSRNCSYVYSNQQFTLYKYYMGPLNSQDSIVKQ